MLLRLGAHGNASLSANGGQTALEAAAEGGHMEIAVLLLRAGAGLFKRPGRLQIATQGGHKGIVELLLAAGAGVNDRPNR